MEVLLSFPAGSQQVYPNSLSVFIAHILGRRWVGITQYLPWRPRKPLMRHVKDLSAASGFAASGLAKGKVSNKSTQNHNDNSC